MLVHLCTQERRKMRSDEADPHGSLFEWAAFLQLFVASSPEPGRLQAQAAMCLCAQELRRRRTRSDKADPRGFLVEWGLLPGALALLQEVRLHRSCSCWWQPVAVDVREHAC